MPIDRAQLDAALKGIQESRVSYQDALKLLGESRNLDADVEEIIYEESIVHADPVYKFNRGSIHEHETPDAQTTRIAVRICEKCVPDLEDWDKQTVQKFIKDNIEKKYKAYTATRKDITVKDAVIDTALMPLKIAVALPILAVRVVVAVVQDVADLISRQKHTSPSQIREILHPRKLYEFALDLASGPRNITAMIKAKLVARSLQHAVRTSAIAVSHASKSPGQRGAAR